MIARVRGRWARAAGAYGVYHEPTAVAVGQDAHGDAEQGAQDHGQRHRQRCLRVREPVDLLLDLLEAITPNLPTTGCPPSRAPMARWPWPWATSSSRNSTWTARSPISRTT